MSLVSEEAWLYDDIGNRRVHCNLCHLRCEIPDGHRGRCNVRENSQGKLYTLASNRAVAFDFANIERIPLYHYSPGSKILEMGTLGCNFRCSFCCAWPVSQNAPEKVPWEELSPKEVVKAAKESNCKGIVQTYTEPTVAIEYCHAIAEEAHKAGVFNALVTNGYFTQDTLELITPVVDAISLTPKGVSDDFYQTYCGVPSVQPILDNAKALYQSDVHLEIAYVLIPGYNDGKAGIRKLARFIREELGEDVPLEFLRYFSSYKMRDVPITPEVGLEKARKTALEGGLKYVYVCNTYQNPGKNTYCPVCNQPLIERVGEQVAGYHMGKDGSCSNCGNSIPVSWFNDTVPVGGDADV